MIILLILSIIVFIGCVLLVRKLYNYLIKRPINYYVDFDSGDDSKSGRSRKKAKKTWEALDKIIPYHIKRPTIINTYVTTSGDLTVEKEIDGNGYLLFDGGMDEDNLVDDDYWYGEYDE